MIMLSATSYELKANRSLKFFLPIAIPEIKPKFAWVIFMDTIPLHTDIATIWHLLGEVNDPEVPVLTILDLGIVRDVRLQDDEVEVVITPTYTGCPAMDAISMDIRLKLLEHGYKKIKITSVLSPAWTTEWMSKEGKQKLAAYGIAPPGSNSNEIIHCPLCNSANVKLVSHFGSTACKSLYQCNDCKEPFDHFKCH